MKSWFSISPSAFHWANALGLRTRRQGRRFQVLLTHVELEAFMDALIFG